MLKRRAVRLLVRSIPWVVLSTVAVALNAAPNGDATRLLRSPTVSATQIAFAYANNIWVVERSGGLARRLTSFQGQTTNPHFHPTAARLRSAGNMPATRTCMSCPPKAAIPNASPGIPAPTPCRAGRPTARRVLFASGRASWAPNAAARFWTVPAAGGVEQPLPLPRGYQGKISRERNAHRVSHEQLLGRGASQLSGGQNRPIWIVDLKTYDLVSPPWTDSKDMDPVWSGDSVYFLSDRDGVSNVWAFDTKARKLTQTTKFTDFDVKSIDAGGGGIVFEQAGRIHSARSEERQEPGRRDHRAR